jgi:hypothetical protein
VVQQLGGRIWADVSPLGGARIAFELPAATVERAGRASTDDDVRLTSHVA